MARDGVRPRERSGTKTGRSDLCGSNTSKPVSPREAMPHRPNDDRFTTRALGAEPVAAKSHRPVPHRAAKAPQRAVRRSGPAPERCRKTVLERKPDSALFSGRGLRLFRAGSSVGQPFTRYGQTAFVPRPHRMGGGSVPGQPPARDRGPGRLARAAGLGIALQPQRPFQRRPPHRRAANLPQPAGPRADWPRAGRA